MKEFNESPKSLTHDYVGEPHAMRADHYVGSAKQRDLLGSAGYDLTEAENGEEAIASVARRRPDLILMDIQLPVMDGYEATRRIRTNPDLRSVPIIAVTSYALAGDEDKALAAGCNGYVTKPYSPRDLLAKVRTYLA